jgi:serine protease SohB
MSIDSERQLGFGFNRAMQAILPEGWWKSGPLVPVLRLTGVIGSAGMPFRQGLTLTGCANSIERAFSIKSAKAIAIQINSPGGSPVQSRLIYERIRSLAVEKSLKVYIFCEDVAASGGYLLALAGDEIYADASSIVGSIGVVYSGFGFVELLQKVGVERRVYTAGEEKVILDPFRPEKPEDVTKLKRLQDIIHQDFIALVKERRGRNIEGATENLFTGEFWTGRQALELGLIDGIMDIRTKMRALYGEDVRLKLVSPERGLFRRRIPGVASAMPGIGLVRGEWSLTRDVLSAIEERSLWGRYGL